MQFVVVYIDPKNDLPDRKKNKNRIIMMMIFMKFIQENHEDHRVFRKQDD